MKEKGVGIFVTENVYTLWLRLGKAERLEKNVIIIGEG
jgi:hypothetical protein